MNRAVLFVLISASVTGCGGGGGDPGGSMPSSSTSPARAASEKVSFTAFTEGLLASRPEGADPVPVTLAQFTFPDDDNPAAFSAVLAGT